MKLKDHTQEEWCRHRKNGYIRSVKMTRKSALRNDSETLHALWKKDLARAIHYRQLQRLCRQWEL